MASIREILKNPVYKGQLVTGRRAMELFHRMHNGEVAPIAPGEKSVVQRPREQWIIKSCPALVSAELWDAVQRKIALRGDRSRGARSRRHSYPLGSLVKCGDCGGGMVGMKTDRSHQVYVCSEHYRNRSCHQNSIRQQILLNVLRNSIRNRLFFGGNMEAFRESLLSKLKSRPECNRREADRIRHELRDAKADLDKAAKNLLLVDPENVPILNAKMTELRNRVAALEAEQAALQNTTEPKVAVDEIVAKATSHWMTCLMRRETV